MSLLDDARTLFQRIERRQLPPAQPPEEDDEEAREKLTRYEVEFLTRTLALSEDLIRDQYSLSEWLALMEIELRYLHVVAAALGKGGFGALTPDDLYAVQRIVARETNYLTRWGHTLTRPTPRDTRRLKLRLALYAGAARATYSTFFARALGLPELPFQPAVQTECLNNCRCYWRIRRVGTADWDCTWVRNVNDSCPTCKARERACNPLRIRNGMIQPFDATGTLA